jgi:hypothetical protein
MTTATTSALKLTKAERDELRQLVHLLVHHENACVIDHAREMPGHGRWPTVRELDMRDWGITYGVVAGGLALKQPLTDPDARAKVAASIAVEAYARWGGEISPRKNLTELINPVIASRENDTPGIQHDAILALTEAWGCPEPQSGEGDDA